MNVSDEHYERLQRCAAILKKIVKLCDSGNTVTFEYDLGGNTLTVITEEGHSHMGVPDGSFEHLVDEWYNTFNGGPGLSWYPQHPPEVENEESEH